MLGDLSGRTALVTGAGSGIGRGIATVLAAQNAAVAFTDLNGEWAEDAASAAGRDTLAVQLDVTDPASVDAGVGKVLAQWGALDILVNNAGIPADPEREGGIDREEDWDRTFAVNVKGPFHCCEAVIPHMMERNYGKIINIASVAAHAERRTGGPYAASKAALLRFTKGLAHSLAVHNINVNAICPGPVWTRLQQAEVEALRTRDAALADVDPEELFWRQYEDMVPLGRPVTPEDIGRAASFLASDDARNITGQCLHVDGGAVMRD